MKICCEFGGGIETLFQNKNAFTLDTATNANLITLRDLILHLATDCDKPELFIKDESVYGPLQLLASSTADVCINSRPGILVLVNDADWELEGMESYALQDKDRITFISTLHGG